ncbi:hypothetical protein D9M69_470920 [compost metagenome]
MVPARFTEEHQVAILWAERIFQCQAESRSGEPGQWNGAGAVVLGVGKARHALFQVDLVAKQAGDF